MDRTLQIPMFIPTKLVSSDLGLAEDSFTSTETATDEQITHAIALIQQMMEPHKQRIRQLSAYLCQRGAERASARGQAAAR